MSQQTGSTLSFRILGPIEIRAGDRAVAVTSAKQQALLGAALLQANAVVPTAKLIDAIWGELPPSTAPELVHTYVSMLRRSIGRPAAGCIVTRPPGYLLRVDQGMLDVHQFEQLSAEAERSAAGGDYERATHQFEEALSRWRGPALAGLDSQLFRAAAARLEELRLLAIEHRFDAASHLGPSRWLVAELTAFVAEHPLRESTRALLMRVLYRLGRQAEALLVYQEGYRVLHEELGVEPGPQLRFAHQAILAGDPAPAPAGGRIDLGDGTPDEATTVPIQRPYQLPPPPARLVGRAADEEALVAALVDAARVARPVLVTVDGPAGVGKTALALAVAHRTRDAFPDGQLFVPLRSTGAEPMPVGDALAIVLRSVGGAAIAIPPSVDERAALLRTMLAGRRVLLLLDDVWFAAQVHPFLGTHPGCAVLVTCRPALADLEADLRWSVGPLSDNQAAELFSHMAGPARVAADAAAASAIVAACDGLPLAVRAAAARLVTRPVWALAALARRVLDPRRRLDQLSVGYLDMRMSIAGGYARLDPPERSALRLLSAAEAELTSPRIAAHLRTSVANAERIADRLADARLLEHDGDDDRPHYRMPALVRLYAQEQVHQP